MHASTASWSGRIRSAALAFLMVALLDGCRERSALPTPNSVESLCFGAPAHAQRIFKLPGIDSVRNDRLVKTQDLHVDVEALERIAASPARERAEPELDEDAVRLYVTDNGGGVLVWWRGQPVTLRYAPLDVKLKLAKAQVYAAAVADGLANDAGRLIYLLERPLGSAQMPTWHAFAVKDAEHVCT